MLLKIIRQCPEGTRGLNLPDVDSSHKIIKLVSATGTILIFKE